MLLETVACGLMSLVLSYIWVVAARCLVVCFQQVFLFVFSAAAIAISVSLDRVTSGPSRLSVYYFYRMNSYAPLAVSW